MSERRVFLDANVIIEAFRINVWPELSRRWWLETVQECEREALTGRTDIFGRVPVDAHALRSGLRESYLIERTQRNHLTQAHPTCLEMDPGEKDLFAYLFMHHRQMPPLIVLSSGDKGVIVKAKQLGWLQNLISLEELLYECGVSRVKLASLDTPHRATFLSEVRTKVMLGVIP